MRARRGYWAAATATAVVALFLGIPTAAFFATHPLPAGTWVMVVIPNAILFAGGWLVVFLVVRALLAPRRS